MARLSKADKVTARFVSRQVRDYGPITKAHAIQLTEAAQRQRTKEDGMLAHGLARLVDEMQPGEVISGSAPWWNQR